MSATLIARSITVRRGRQLVLDAIDLTLAPGHRVGLVGPNGVGKSTLLGALAGVVQLDEGSVELAPASATVGLLPQEPRQPPASPTSAGETVRELVARRTGVRAAQGDLDGAVEALAAGEDGAADRYDISLTRWLALGAADLDVRLAVTLDDLGLDPGIADRPVASLSGGQASRCSLAALILSRFDVLLLDEPTNDLDLDGLDHLERWVTGVSAPVLLVSHDRTFLERVVTDVVEIDHHTHRASWYSGSWTSFRTERERARRHAQERYDVYDAQRSTLQRRAQREREWAAQGQAKVQRSGENDKFIRAFRMNQTEQLAGKAARTQRAIERLEVVEEPRDRWELRLTIPVGDRGGDRVMWARAAAVERGAFRLGPVDVEIVAGDRVAVVGPNGSGKSTLIELLLGEIAPSEGAVGRGPSVRVGGIDQARAQLSGDRRLVDVVADATGATHADARTLLAKFDLRADHVERPTSSLSPGERTRATMALLMGVGANVLVLDEPTNHLDVEAIEALERALESYAGTVLLVTHDRAFLERFRSTRVLDVVAGSVSEAGRPR
jgi:ATPase subunit of ABC transporter with duplicated ATPase domains